MSEATIKPIVVTGANGFVGSHVVRRLAEAGHPVRAMVRRPGDYHAPAGVEVILGDLTRAETLGDALHGGGALVHAAAITANYKEPYKGAYRQINEVGTSNLMAQAVEAGIDRVVLVSGLGTRPAAAGTYMATRWGMEEAVRKSGIPYVIVQPSVQFGDDAEFVKALAKIADVSPVVPAMTGAHTRFQPIWIEDVVTVVEKSLVDDSLLGREVAIGGSEYATFRQIVQTILQVSGKKRLVAPLPVAVAKIQAAMLGFLPKPPLTSATLELFSFDNTTDLDSVEKNFGFRPRGFTEYLKANGLHG
ncbi:MAG TPA: NAD(P)H-binding protein [Candidatus Dormibacteraeota bacterium]|nr:NAD(P)H-binding protein [Candidatus Dormibacteraeota bacterium]